MEVENFGLADFKLAIAKSELRQRTKRSCYPIIYCKIIEQLYEFITVPEESIANDSDQIGNDHKSFSPFRTQYVQTTEQDQAKNSSFERAQVAIYEGTYKYL